MSNELAQRRLLRLAIEQYNLPDGKYELSSFGSALVDPGSCFRSTTLMFSLPEGAPVKPGSCVVGDGEILLAIKLTSHIDLEGPIEAVFSGMEGPVEDGGKSLYKVFGSIRMKVFEDSQTAR